MSKTRSLTLPFGLGQASFWMSVCITLSFAAVHLKARGFSNTELGLVMAVGNILGALLGPLLASLAETHPRLRNTPCRCRGLCRRRPHLSVQHQADPQAGEEKRMTPTHEK